MKNNSLKLYWAYLLRKSDPHNGKLHLMFISWFQAGISLAGQIIKDAGVELFFLVIFWFIITKMGQGRDLIVSLFEPDKIYHVDRIVYTLLATIGISISMWIVPAFIFQERDDKNKSNRFYTSIFKRHLFFIHRILPLIPFWLLSYVLFNGDYTSLLFGSISIIQLIILHLFIEKVQADQRKWWIWANLLLLIAATVCFMYFFNSTYTEAKIALVVILYLLSFLLSFVYYMVDDSILRAYLAPKKESQSRIGRYKLNSWMYIGFGTLHLLVVVIIFLRQYRFEIAPESILLYIFSLNIFIIDLFVYLINVSHQRKFVISVVIVAIVGIYLSTNSVNLTLAHYQIDHIKDTAGWTNIKRLTFEEKYAQLKQQIEQQRDTTIPFPILLVSGEGGGSRAGMWFSQNMIDFDYYTRGNLRKHLFSISTVSGSSVGLGTLITFWEHAPLKDTVEERWRDFPSKIYSNNFVGSSISGLLLTDFWRTLWPFSHNTEDRNSVLQHEEAYHTQRACMEILQGKKIDRHMDIPENDMLLLKNFMGFFYDRDTGKLRFKENRPLVFINTCRSDDGRRGIFSQVKLSNDYFNDALDLAGYMYEDSICDFSGKRLGGCIKKSLSLGQACNTSELFPLFSAPVYIDSIGNFVDGGYHENTGLKTTLDVYHKLKDLLVKDKPRGKYKIYIVYLKNGSTAKNLYKPLNPEIPFLSPVQAFSNQPFQGSASYFEEQARFLGEKDKDAQYIELALDYNMIINARSTYKNSDSARIEEEILNDLSRSVDNSKGSLTLNFPLARWLSNSIIRRLRSGGIADSTANKKMMALLDTINILENSRPVSLASFKKHATTPMPKRAVSQMLPK